MNFLLDTHTFIWFINGDKLLPKNIIKAIKNIENTCNISIASIWEMGIKISLGKLAIISDFNKISDILSENDIGILPITLNHLDCLLKLDYYHRDPFDRIIISQAICEKLTILTKDSEFKKYKVEVKWD